MAFLKSRKGHAKSTFGIYWYLTRSKQNEDRVVASDFINLGTEAYRQNIGCEWYQMMDETRTENNNNRDWGSAKARTYNHYIISPNPKDSIDVDTLRALSTQWAWEHFSEYEVAIIYHNDNNNNIPHAHVVVNNTNLTTGKRCHVDKKMSALLKDSLQIIAKEYDLRYFDNDKDDKQSTLHQTEIRQEGFAALSLNPDRSESQTVTRQEISSPPTLQERYLTYAERHVDDTGRLLWKDDIRARVDMAFRSARTEQEFLSACTALDLTVSNTAKGNDYLFIHPERDSWKCAGNTLGYGYTPGGIRQRLFDDRKAGRAHGIKDKEKLQSYLQGFRKSATEPIAYIRCGSDITLKDVARAMSFTDAYNIKTLKDFAAMAERFSSDEKTSQVIYRMRQIAYDCGAVSSLPTTNAQTPYRLPPNLDKLSNQELAHVIRDTYKKAGFKSGNERKAGGMKAQTQSASKRRRTTKDKNKAKAGKE